MKRKDNHRFQRRPQRICGKTLKLQTKSSSNKFCYIRDFATATGDEVNADIASEVVQHFGGFREDFVLYFSEIIKTTWIWRKIILVFLSRILQYAYKMI